MARYGRYRRTDGDVVELRAEDTDKELYERKGFEFVEYTLGPTEGRLGPRDIDRDDSGIPKGPDGSTHERHPYEVTPDGDVAPPVQWGIPLDTPEATHATEKRVDETNVDRGKMLSPDEEMKILEDATKPRALRGRDPLLAEQDTPRAPERESVAGDITRVEDAERLAVREEVSGGTHLANANLGLTSSQLDALEGAGFKTAASVRNASDDDLLAVDGIGEATVRRIREGR